MKLDELDPHVAEVEEEEVEEDSSDLEEDLVEAISLLTDCWTQMNLVVNGSGHRRRGVSWQQQQDIIRLMVEVQAFTENYQDVPI